MVPGIKISEHLPKIAKHAGEMAIIRSMSTKEADHGRATYQMHTGRPPSGPIQYPSLGSLVAKELERDDAELPGFVSIAPFRLFNPAAYGPGFLGPQYAPLIVGENANVFGRQVLRTTSTRRSRCRTSTSPPAWMRSGPRPGCACSGTWKTTSWPSAPGLPRSATAQPTSGPSR